MRHAIQAVVTGETNLAKILNMLSDESRIMIPMAKDAALRRKSKGRVIGKMTILTNHQSRVILHLMPNQAKAGSRMVKKWQGGSGNVKISTAMIRVTIGALFSAQTGAMQPNA